MTQHDPKDVEALIEAFDRYELHRNDSLSIGSYDRLKAARAKLKPKPEKVYVLPPTDAMTVELRYWYISNNLDEREWDTLREVTATDAPASKWNMPEATPQWWLDISRTLWFDGKNSDEYEPHDSWKLIRELTAINAPEPVQKWNMPTLQQINEICGQPYGTAPTNALDTWYEAIRNKIMAMNEGVAHQ